MPVAVIVGMQWGDEGKGKIIDLLAENADVVARYQGGHNAGHTICFNEKQFVLHLIPSGIFHEDKLCVIGNGVVVDPQALVAEMHQLEETGINLQGRLLISDRANIIMPYHGTSDKGRESESGFQKIGTTGRGIGPSYADKIARAGIRICDLRDEAYLTERLRANHDEKQKILKSLYGTELPGFNSLLDELMSHRETILKYTADTHIFLRDQIAQGKHILCEGAQGTMLDVDHGTYPFVTSSNSTAGGACTGLGIPPTKVDRVLGVIKAYTTRVGEGPFPTELSDADGERLGKVGHEFGATTGRPRRCGWFDAVVARYGVHINGVDALILTKVDVLDGFKTIKVCTGYKYKGKVFPDMPADPGVMANCEPVYAEFDGWSENTVGIQDHDKLPQNAKDYISRLSDLVETPFMMISTGPDREQTIQRESLF
ncbi:MAG: adenylosuccinate synthase [Nitrospinae bacterium]|nr:adenylosuccinate synthase [Nitrospinota bacterium]MBL7020182.1 adenylosuccinate synthase [Nitrospinaceae bacterium]